MVSHSNKYSSVMALLSFSPGCEAERDMFGIQWEHAAIGEFVRQTCGADFVGEYYT